MKHENDGNGGKVNRSDFSLDLATELDNLSRAAYGALAFCETMEERYVEALKTMQAMQVQIHNLKAAHDIHQRMFEALAEPRGGAAPKNILN